MSRIDELVRELAPTGVPYVGITEVTDYIRGVTYNKNDEAADGEVSVLRANNITLTSNTLNLAEVKKVSARVRVRDNQRLRAGDILICAGSGSKDHIGKVAYIDANRDETFGGFMAVVRTRDSTYLDPRFVFHLLTGRSFSTYLGSALSTTTINNLNAGVMRGYRIPVPPLEVQREIVRVLDQFTQLEAELEVELEARRRQYEHYRDEALSFGDAVRSVPLGDVIHNLRTGLNPRQNFKLNSPGAANQYITVRELAGFKIIPTDKTDLVDDEGLARIQARSRLQVGDVLFSGTGTIGRTALVEEEPTNWNIKEGVYALTPKRDQISSRFLIHLLRSSVIRQRILGAADGSTVASVSMASLKRVLLPVPSLDEQDRVTTLLDKFEALTNDLSIGLPAELAARRKQYEYYRDKLLTFEEAVA